MSINDLLDKMAAAEDEFLQTSFMAPILANGQVRVRIAGVICTLKLEDKVEAGWAILKPLSLDRATVVTRPSLKQIRDYLALFPMLRLLVVARTKRRCLALPASWGDSRFQIKTPVPVHFATVITPFQQIIARFDGGHFWFQEVDRRRNPAIAAYLNEALRQETPPETLYKPTLTAEERAVYQLNYEAILAARRDKTELRLSDALAHAGGEFTSYIERDDVYTVTFNVDGQRYHSTMAKDDLTILTAGICLAGQDRRFDLQSLVGVIREGREGHRLVAVGDDERLDEETYWQIHPDDSEIDDV